MVAAYDPLELATRVVGSGLPVSEWCREHGGGIGKTSVYRALNWCRLNQPSVFGAGEAEAVAGGGRHGWYARVMAAMRGEGEGREGATQAAHAPASGQRGGFVRLAPDPAPARAKVAPVVGPTCAPAIVVELGGARVSLPSGFAAADAEAAIAATARALGAGVAS